METFKFWIEQQVRGSGENTYKSRNFCRLVGAEQMDYCGNIGEELMISCSERKIYSTLYIIYYNTTRLQ